MAGASGGISSALAETPNLHNAKVYIAACSDDKVAKAISEIKSRAPESIGSLIFQHLDLDDLTTVKSTPEPLVHDNDSLDVLRNNAGVMLKVVKRNQSTICN